jgi:hypothetical protein
LNRPALASDQRSQIDLPRFKLPATHARTIVPITLQGTAGGFSAGFMEQLPRVEQAMIAHGLDPNDFIISKDDAASANARPLGPFFHDYTVFVGDGSFTVTEPNDARFLDYFMDRILAPDDDAPAQLRRDTLFSRLAKWMARPI